MAKESKAEKIKGSRKQQNQYRESAPENKSRKTMRLWLLPRRLCGQPSEPRLDFRGRPPEAAAQIWKGQGFISELTCQGVLSVFRNLLPLNHAANCMNCVGTMESVRRRSNGAKISRLTS